MTTNLDTKTMSVREARAKFSDLLGSVHYTNQPVIIERNGKPYAVVIGPRNLLPSKHRPSEIGNLSNALESATRIWTWMRPKRN